MPRHNEPVSAVISLAAKHRNRGRMQSSIAHPRGKTVRRESPRGLHQLQAGNSEPLDSQAVNFTHLFRSKNFHGRFEERVAQAWLVAQACPESRKASCRLRASQIRGPATTQPAPKYETL